MKKIINSVELVEEQMIEGLQKAFPQYVKRVEGSNVLARAEKKEGKVALVSGGGSGHEPAHAGYVGTGMLDAAVPGAVFTSMVKRVDNACYQLIESVVNGSFAGGTTEYLDLAKGGVSLTDLSVVKEALGDKRGIERYGYCLPMDDCLCQVALDFGGRPWLVWDAEFHREKVGEMPTEMFLHFFKSLSDASRMNLNIKAEGQNEHHKIEGIFKALARALKMAVKRDIYKFELPSTKGML